MDKWASDTESKGFFERLKAGLARTRNAFIKNIDEIFMGERVISQKLFDELEETLIMADVGPAFTYELIEKMKEQAKRTELGDAESSGRSCAIRSPIR